MCIRDRGILKTNFVIVELQKRCETRTLKIVDGVHVKGVKVLSCVVNRSNGFQFYVLPNLRETTSVYLLTSSLDNLDRTQVVIRVENVDVLYGFDFNSKKRRGHPRSDIRPEKRTARKRKPLDVAESSLHSISASRNSPIQESENKN